MKITFIGHGYVGLVTACIFADLGNTVYVLGHTPEKLNRLRSGDPIIFEPGLKELLQKNLTAKRLIFTDSYEECIPNSDIVFITVGTPPKEHGEADLTTVFSVAEEVGKHLKKGYTVVSCKSTVPVGTNKKVLELINSVKPKDAEVDVASCPEFLREGTGLQDTFHPDRIIIGSDSRKAIMALIEVHKPLDGERVVVSLASAELIKYASNSILATKISFANLISFLCEKAGANVEEVLEGTGLDKRIGRIFLSPGVGYGGSCFPKDVNALIHTGKKLGVDMSLLSAVDTINRQAKMNVLEKVKNSISGKKIALWGLAFKPDTDDIREAPSIFLIKELLKDGYEIHVYDPEAMENVKKTFKDTLTYCKNPYEAAKGADCLLILTEWNEFKQIDIEKVAQTMTHKLIIDGRNIYDPKKMKEKDIMYLSVGR